MELYLFITELSVGPGGEVVMEAQNGTGTHTLKTRVSGNPRSYYIGKRIKVTIDIPDESETSKS